MWFLIGEKVPARRVAGGLSVPRACESCGQDATFFECERALAPDGHTFDVLDETQRAMVCGVCGAMYGTDELGPEGAAGAEAGAAGHDLIEGEVMSSTALRRHGGESGGRDLGGGGDGRRPGLLGRIGNLFRGAASSRIERAIDPAKEIEQLIVDMEEQLRKARGESVRLLATRKRAAQRVIDLEKESAMWTGRAEQAVRAGDDDLAKLALGRRAETEARIVEARSEDREAVDFTERHQAALKALDAKLKQSKLRKGTIKAKVTSHRSTEVRAAAFEDFERMAGRVDDAEVAADAEEELRRDGQVSERDAAVEQKFAALERTGRAGGAGEIDDRLAALKRKMDK